jgi:hypothetical protein
LRAHERGGKGEGGGGRERTPFLKLEEKNSKVSVEEEVEKRAPLSDNLETKALIFYSSNISLTAPESWIVQSDF